MTELAGARDTAAGGGRLASLSASRVSIALATFNGAPYLARQLESYCTQTRLPDELFVGDDGSHDETLAILADFSRRAPFPVHVHVNQPRLGHARNFAEVMARCRGDVIFLSDQDDVWMPGKIEKMLRYLAENPRCLLATHDAALVNMEGQALGTTLASQIEASGDEAEHALIAGCCMAIDSRLARLLRPAARTRHHDAWLALAADALKVRGHVAEPLIHYRRHGANVTQSHIYDSQPASRWRRFAERVRRALREAVLVSLDAAAAERQDLVLALHRQRTALAPIVGDDAISSAIAEISSRLAKDLRRAAFLRGSVLRKPALFIASARAGDYAGFDGLLSMARDLFGVLSPRQRM